MLELTATETALSGLAAIGTAYMVVRKTGILSLIGKLNGKNGSTPQGVCPDPSCQAEQKQLVRDVAEIKRTQNDIILPKLEEATKGISYIKGWVDGQRDGHQMG